MITAGFRRACPHVVEVYLPQPVDRYGKNPYLSVPSSILRGRVVQVQKLVRTVDGTEVPSSTTIIVAGDLAFDPLAKIKLPAFTPDVRPIVAVNRFPDPTGAHHVEVYL